MNVETLKPFPYMDPSIYGVHSNIYAQKEMLDLFNERERLLERLYKSGKISYREINFFRNYSKTAFIVPTPLYFFMVQVELLKNIELNRPKPESTLVTERIPEAPKAGKLRLITNIESYKTLISSESFESLNIIRENLDKIHDIFMSQRIRKIVDMPNIVLRSYLNSELPIDDPKYNRDLPKMNSIKKNISRLLDTYISTSINSDISRLDNFLVDNQASIIKLIQDAYGMFTSMYETHIPIFTDAISYFDSLDSRDKTILSLGRDGIYFMVAHTASMNTRRSKKTEGLNPHKTKYLVFPRGYVTDVAYPNILSYLHQNGISEETIKNTIFLDTGFMGTIPEYILCILGVDPYSEDAEFVRNEGIVRLLSAAPHKKESYQIPLPSIGPDSFSKVQSIEDSPKHTKKSKGLSLDSEGFYAAEVDNDPNKVFLYSVLKQVLARHFYIINSGLQAQNV